MRIALLGHGRMTRAVERLAADADHEIGVIVTSDAARLPPAALAKRLHGHDVVIDFTSADAVSRNVDACLAADVPLVEGTTGWDGDVDRVVARVRDENGAMVYAANFSVGVALFTRIAAYGARLFRSFAEYDAFLEEAHHAAKRDAPSGTALRLREAAEAELHRTVPITSTRAGHIPGTHRIGFDGPADQVLLTHRARSRDGFAAGALLAAGWIAGRRGVYGFQDVLDDVLGESGGSDDAPD